jgi:hypothetical protein
MVKINTSTETVTKISDDLMMTARVGTDNVRHAQLMDDASNVINALQARAETAEAKLTKAVKALRSYVSKEKGVWNTADAVLAELEKPE